MAGKKNNYITDELNWCEEKLQQWKDYIDANPYGYLRDRLSYKETKNGGVIPMVVATIEQQQKSLRDALKEYFSLLETVNKLREAEEKKLEARGGKDLGGMMAEKLSSR